MLQHQFPYINPPWIAKIRLLCIAYLIYCGASLTAQNLEGQITALDGAPLSFVNVYVKEIQSGTSSDETGHYFITLDPGSYEVVYSSLGYLSQTISVAIGDGAHITNIQLKLSDVKLDEIVIKAKKKDAAYEIIQNVIAHKKRHLRSLSSSKSAIYIKAKEELTETERKRKKKALVVVDIEEFDPAADPFDKAKDALPDSLANINMTELLLELNYKAPGQYKEIRSGHKKYGNTAGLFIPTFSETDFNFYKNLVTLKGIADIPVISPFSTTAILTYKFKLLSSVLEEGILVHKIQVTPRKAGNGSCRGLVYVNEGIWTINRLDLNLAPGALKLYDAFQLKQDYQLIGDSIWLVGRQEFIYGSKQSKRKAFNGSTLLTYTDIQPNYTFPEKYFNSEVAITTQEAFDRDTSYWNVQRAEPLTSKEQEVVYYRDSIERLHKSEAYLDSTQKAFNKVTAGEILWHGLGFRNNFKKSHIYFNSLLDLIGFEVIGGLRLGPYSSYSRRWESGRIVRTSGHLDVGLKNIDVQGNANFWTRYNPYKLADFGVSGGRGFQSINSFDAYLNQLKRSNYILHDYLSANHDIELFNGFYLRVSVNYSARKSIEGYDSETFLGNIFDDDVPIQFDNYEALITQIGISYTPAQRFMSEPNRKVVLGSKYPTFGLIYKKGWHDVLGSDIDWDYLEAGVTQDLVLGTLGSSKYTFRIGKSINTNDIRYVDLLRFRQSDPVLFSVPLHSFQLLDTSIATTGLFYEAHYIHHFNGALMNNIPLIKKLKLRVAVGGGALYVKSANFHHQELFGGVERIFKIGARRRLRLGIFGVVGDSNKHKPDAGFKISLDIIDTWKKDWSH